MVDQIFAVGLGFAIGLIVFLIVRAVLDKSDANESAVFKFLERDLLDSEQEWCGGNSDFKNITRGYSYQGWNSQVCFYNPYEGTCIDYTVVLTNSENKKLQKIARKLIAKKFLEAKDIKDAN